MKFNEKMENEEWENILIGLWSQDGHPIGVSLQLAVIKYARNTISLSSAGEWNISKSPIRK